MDCPSPVRSDSLPGAAVMADARADAISHTDATRASVSVDDERGNNVIVQSGSSSGNAPLPGSYASVTRVNRVPDDVIPVTGENALPNRPLTVSFQPRYFLPACDVFDALRNADLDNTAVSCVQRLSSGTIVLTFRRPEQKNAFLSRNFISVHDQPLALQDVDRPLTFVQVFDAPHELPDTAVISRLSKYCDVISNRRGYFREPGWENVQDGVRHFRVRLRSPIPSFLRFGKFLVHVRYPGQQRTCRHCHQPGHLANTCSNQCCFNCDEVGHLSSSCPRPVMCNLCKSVDHKANVCPFSWAREPTGASPPREDVIPVADPVCNDNTTNNTTTNNADSHDETDDDMSEDENEEDENEEQLHAASEPDDVFVAAAGISLPTRFDTDSPTEDVSPDKMDETPQATVEESPLLFSVDETGQDVCDNTATTTPNSGRRPAKLMEVIIPLRNPTQPTLVTGKSAEKRDNPDLSGPSDVEASPKRNKPSRRKKRK